MNRYEGYLPLATVDQEWGEVKVVIIGEELISIDRESFLQALKPLLRPSLLKEISHYPYRFHPSALSFRVIYDHRELKLLAEIELKHRSKSRLPLKEHDIGLKQRAIPSAPFGGAISAQLEHNWGSQRLGQQGLNGQFNSFLNLKSLVLENQTYYQESMPQAWFRGDTRLVKDLEKQQVRTQLGDVYPQIQGFMTSYPMGGLSIQRNFSLNPYRHSYPTETKSFSIKSRSLVKYFINGTLVKTEYLPTGNYSITDIPLNNGLNTILIEATDELGLKQIFTFNSATNINLLNQGESRFDLSYGVPFSDSRHVRNYRYDSGKVFSGFFQYGITPNSSTSLYLQNQQDFNLMGIEAIKASSIGNFVLGHAQSTDQILRGEAYSLNYQMVSLGTKYLQSHSIALRFENRTEDFKSHVRDATSVVKDQYAISYSLPIANMLSLSIGCNYGNVRNNALSDRYGYDSTLNLKLSNRMNLAAFVSRNRNENKAWNDSAHFFLTINFPSNSDFITTLYDQQNKSTRTTYLHDNKAQLYNVRSQVIAENSETSQSGELDLLYPTPYGNFGGRIAGRKFLEEDNTFAKGSLRMHSALAFAYHNGNWGLSLSRPIPGSFAIFSPDESLQDQPISLKSTSPFNDSERGLFGELTFSNLIAYQYRNVQLDPTLMDQGRSLTQERYVLYPTYRSAHLVPLKERGSVSIQGQLVTKTGNPVALQVGHLGEITFFTNRDGKFYVEGIEPGTYTLILEDMKGKANIKINKNKHGIIDLKQVYLEETL